MTISSSTYPAICIVALLPQSLTINSFSGPVLHEEYISIFQIRKTHNSTHLHLKLNREIKNKLLASFAVTDERDTGKINTIIVIV